MATSFVTSASGDSGFGSSTLSFSAGMPNDQLPNSLLVFTYAETSSVITDVNVINGATTTPMPLIPNSTVSFDLGFLQAYFISIPAGNSNSFLTTSDIVINRNSGEPGLAAAALWLSTGSTGYVSAINASSSIGTYSLNDQSKGSGESLRISTVWTTRDGAYYTTGDPGGAGAEDWWADVSTSTHILEVQATNATANRAEIVIETNASKGNSSVGFGGSGPAFTPAALALCISDTWPRNTLVRNRPFNVGIRANIPGFINSPHRP